MPASTSPKARQSFDYASLNAETCQFVQQQTSEIRGLMKRTAQGIVEIGQKLIQIKQRLGHGQFENWLKAEFEWTQMTANRFMNVAKHFKSNKLLDLSIAPSALYELAAPSTPAAVREEALARAKAGELISHKTAKALKQKYASPPTKSKSEHLPEPETVAQPQSLPQQAPTLAEAPVSTPQLTPTPPPQSGSKPKIVAIRPQVKAKAQKEASKPILLQVARPQSVPQPFPPVSAPDVLGDWWQLGGRHLLYRGHPNSDEFLRWIPQDVQLLLAFPPAKIWRSRISASATLILTDYLPVFQKPELLDEVLESLILRNSRLGDLVVTCFLPSPDILYVLNRLDRRGVLAEPDSRRFNAVVSDWKRAGLKAERLS